MYHSTVMQRPDEEEERIREESARRDRINHQNGASRSNPRPSPTQQSDFHHPPFASTNGSHPRPSLNNNSYHPPPPTPASLPMPTSTPTPASQISAPPASPRTLTTPAPYSGDYQPVVPRDKPTSSYYDPTADARAERRSSESAVVRAEGQSSTPQVRRASRDIIPRERKKERERERGRERDW